MELSDLRSFVDVAETLNIRRAATAAGVRPSTLSRRIARIEGELGVSVFERHASGVRLTRAGRDFLDTASNAIRDIEFGLRRARAASNGASGHLRIGIFASIASGFPHEAIRLFRSHYSGVEIDVTEGEPNALLRRIRERKLDIAFVTGDCDLRDLDCETLWREAVALALASDHPAADAEWLQWSELRDERFIISLQEPGPEIHDWLVARLGGLGERTRIVRYAVARETLFVLVGLGFGLSVVSQAGVGVAYPNVVFRPVGDPDDTLPFSVAWSPDRDNPALRRFLSVMRAMASGRPPPPVN
jgi:DNA-binding transcriptional LysR family regulator